MKLKALGLFVLITGAVASGIWIADWALRYRADLQRAEEIRSQTCREVASDPDFFGGGDFVKNLLAECKKEGF